MQLKFASPETLTTIAGEPAVLLESMPESWQRIVVGKWMTEPRVYTAMAQVFWQKSTGKLSLCRATRHSTSQNAYCEGNGLLAWEAVAHFGEAFLPESYPDLVQIREAIQVRDIQQKECTALVNIVSDLFDELGYDVPATFYWTFLHPLQRSNLFEVRSFRFSEQDLGIARKFDAILHGGYVSMLRRLIDSVSSRHGYFLEHGCGCENHLAKLKACDSSFTYTIPDGARQKTLRAFLWSVMEEYLLFELRSATRLVYADNLVI